MQKVLVLSFNYEPSQFPKQPDDSARFFTYGFGPAFANLFHKYLKNYKIETWRVDSYCKEKYYEKEIDGLKYRVFKSFRINKLGHFSRAFIKELKKECKKSSPIIFIVHTHNWQTYQIAYFLRGEKIITTHHGDWSPYFMYETESGLKKLRALLGIWAEKITFKNIDYFLLCDYDEIPYVKKSAPLMKYIIFSAGLDIGKFKIIPKDDARKQLGWDPDKKYLLYVGKLYKYKQIGELLDIWKDIRSSRPEVELVLAGNEPEGSWGEEYYSMAKEYGAKIIGRVLNNELYKYYCASDVYVLMALRKDNFGGIGIAPLESIACNTPVVSYSLRNYLGPNADEIGETPASLDDYKTAILKVLDHRDEYKNLRQSVEEYYSYEAMAAHADGVFKEIMKKNMNN